jgi:hypothetical protein
VVQSQPRQIVLDTLSQQNPSPQGLVEWLKMQALSSSPSTGKKSQKKKKVSLLTLLPFVIVKQFSMGHLSQFPSGVIMNNTAMNILVHTIWRS